MSTEKGKQTEAVVNHHVQALVARNLDALLGDYTEDSVFLVNLAPGPVIGLAALRAFFAQALETFTAEILSSLKTERLEIAGEAAFMVWSAGSAIPFGTDTYVVRDGKIVVQTAFVQFGQAR